MEDAEDAANSIFPQILTPIGGGVGSYLVATQTPNCTGGLGEVKQCENPFGIDPVTYAAFLDSDGAPYFAAFVVAFIAWAVTVAIQRYQRSH